MSIETRTIAQAWNRMTIGMCPVCEHRLENGNTRGGEYDKPGARFTVYCGAVDETSHRVIFKRQPSKGLVPEHITAYDMERAIRHWTIDEDEPAGQKTKQATPFDCVRGLVYRKICPHCRNRLVGPPQGVAPNVVGYACRDHGIVIRSAPANFGDNLITEIDVLQGTTVLAHYDQHSTEYPQEVEPEIDLQLLTSVRELIG